MKKARSSFAFVAALAAALFVTAAFDRAAGAQPAAADVKPSPGAKSGVAVKPGINDTWKSSDVDRLVGILEAEDREIFLQRANLAALVGPKPGAAVADIGAGSGFLAEELARLVGPGGKVYAVDINPKMMRRVEERMRVKGLGDRVEAVTCREDSVDLPPQSIDIAFVCDTYHHFEYPESTLRSIYEALRGGGQLVVVEFHRVEGKATPWVLEHVRAGQEVFTREIEEAGFELINVHDVPFLTRNYVLRFRKPE
jgi:SAM-dependent methyltransferase